MKNALMRQTRNGSLAIHGHAATSLTLAGSAATWCVYTSCGVDQSKAV